MNKYYNKKLETTEEEKKESVAYEKCGKESSVYYLKISEGFLINPFNISDFELNRRLKTGIWKKVSVNIFEEYKKFLETKSNLLYRNLERRISLR